MSRVFKRVLAALIAAIVFSALWQRPAKTRPRRSQRPVVVNPTSRPNPPVPSRLSGQSPNGKDRDQPGGNPITRPFMKIVRRLPQFPRLLVSIAAGLTVILSISPELRGKAANYLWPDHQEVDLTPPVVKVEDITFRDYLRGYLSIDDGTPATSDNLVELINANQIVEPPVTEDDITDELLDSVGVVLSFDFTFTGVHGRLPIEWSMYGYDAKSGKRVFLSDSYVNNQPAFPQIAIEPIRGRSEKAGMEIWVPLPARAGPFVVTITIYDDKELPRRTKLDEETSEAFHVPKGFTAEATPPA